ncbi:DUF402 domain-containing protein [Paenibacillus sp. H1-7]|uniref:DUF402 domain-containing protein n=1 Tax=Paenibacillus sp. H1-7 TaxID=2282849 RepID=UPI001EF991E4|nr:DUF402 domain-containing protein [Paenibacillus sp. H1-7]
MEQSRFHPGDHTILRRVWKDQIYRVTTTTVVEDTPELIALYWGIDYPIKSTRNPLKVSSEPLPELRDGTWGNSEVLMLIPANAAYAIYAFRDSAAHFSWYINLQEPLRRTKVGFDTTDYLLDITLDKERSEWKWKDEADFNNSVAAGIISPDKAQAIRSEGVRALQWVQEGPAAFFDAWENWRPTADWKIPSIPAGWDQLHQTL